MARRKAAEVAQAASERVRREGSALEGLVDEARTLLPELARQAERVFQDKTGRLKSQSKEAALVMGRKAQGGGGGRRKHEPDPSPAERLMQMARERPILAAAGALAAGVVALKNPQAIASVVSAVIAARAADKVDRRR